MNSQSSFEIVVASISQTFLVHSAEANSAQPNGLSIFGALNEAPIPVEQLPQRAEVQFADTIYKAQLLPWRNDFLRVELVIEAETFWAD